MSTTDAQPADAPTPELAQDLLDSYIVKTFMERFTEGRDLRAIISADNADTGVGKTTLGVNIAWLLDIWGWRPAKATLDPRHYTMMYDVVPPGTFLYLIEAEQALERRRSMSNEVLAVGHDFATKRYRQVFGLLDLPSKSMMDARIADKLCDLWILVRDRGEADVFRFDENQFTNQVYYHKVEELAWSPLDGHPYFETVERMKRDWMEGETASRYVTREEFNKAKKNFWRKAEAKTTYEFLTTAWKLKQEGVIDATQEQLGHIAGGMTQSNVSKIVNSDSFEDFYRSFDGDGMGVPA